MTVSDKTKKDLKEAVRVPGFTTSPEDVDHLVTGIVERLAVFFYRQESPCVWISFMGGTGTGKSTLFNAFCGRSLSETGVERPKTNGPIGYSPEACQVPKDFPFPDVPVDRYEVDDSPSTHSSGRPGRLILFTHHRDTWSHLIVLDTPDMDSVESQNLAMVERFYLFADVVVFVTSQDKYADEVPYQFLKRISENGKPCFLLVNKTDDVTKQDILSPLQGHGTSFPEHRIWLIPYHPSGSEAAIAGDPEFSRFSQTLFNEVSPKRSQTLYSQEQDKRAKIIAGKIGHLSATIEKEHHEAQAWLRELNRLFENACDDLVKAEKQRFAAESRQHLQQEIRKLFQRYDPLSKPRQLIRDVLSAPFQLIGMSLGRRPNQRKNSLSKVRQKIDLTPVWGTVERFNRSALENLSPEREDAPLFKALHQTDIALTEEEIRSHMLKEHDQLDQWLERKFKELARGLPRHKRWGIYSTSILWGSLILSFEIVVGGGFSGLDAVLDSVLAPFITKGSMELFAYREIKAVATELARQYQEALRSVVKRQKLRYETALNELLTQPDDLAFLKRLQTKMETVPQGMDDD